MKAATASAPGRVNLIGEHTDYNGGLVLPLALPLATRVTLTPRSDRDVIVTSTRFGTAHYRLGEEERTGTFVDYVQGATFAMRRHAIEAGFDLLIASDVPPGGGLASSAALLVAIVRALRDALSLAIDDRTVAQLAHAAEHDFVDAPVGIMDQMVASLGTLGSAFFLDVRSGSFESIALDPAIAIVVIDSGIIHAHASGAYRTRREECARAAKALAVPELRDARLEEVGRLPAPIERRARHVITENARVEEAVVALRARDHDRLGSLFDASHVSMRDDYEISIPEVDALVATLRAQAGTYGARLTGGGFGGSVIALVDRGRAAAIVEAAIASAGVGSARFVVTAP